MLGMGLLAWAAPVLAGEGEVRRGRQLFDAPWRVPAGQDPLGPLLNATACADCHPGGEAGAPGGPALVLRTGGDPLLGQQIQPLAIAGLVGEAVPPPRLQPVAVAGEVLRRAVWQSGERRLAGRLAPGLRGAGLLALIPDAVLGRAADPTGRGRRRGVGAAGCGPVRPQGGARHPGGGDRGGPGRRHGARDTLAAATGRRLHARPAGMPGGGRIRDAGGALGHRAADGVRGGPAAATRRRAGGRGAELFATAGCGTCHAGPYVIASDPAVTGRPVETIAPYTDLLLHDLGPGLADPFRAPGAAAGEWRTAPLWGLRHRAALLHDGRAGSVREAILWHDGEAAGSRRRFLALAADEQADLLRFLAGL